MVTSPNLPFLIRPTHQVIVFIGIQASGKSTFYETMLARLGYAHINLDTLRTRHQERLAIEACYKSKTSFVVDNTNPEITDRARYIPEAKAQGYEVVGIFFQSIVRDCIERNEKRDRQVPRHVIPCTQNKLQLPTYAEGFDRLYFARIVDGGYELTDWEE